MSSCRDYQKGDVVWIEMPYTDLTGSKLRPAILLSKLAGLNCIFCMISTKKRPIPYIINLTASDFQPGSNHLRMDCYIIPDMIFTLNRDGIAKKEGTVIPDKITEVVTKINAILNS
jgi:mRNA interferase MazF